MTPREAILTCPPPTEQRRCCHRGVAFMELAGRQVVLVRRSRRGRTRERDPLRTTGPSATERGARAADRRRRSAARHEELRHARSRAKRRAAGGIGERRLGSARRSAFRPQNRAERRARASPLMSSCLRMSRMESSHVTPREAILACPPPTEQRSGCRRGVACESPGISVFPATTKFSPPMRKSDPRDIRQRVPSSMASSASRRVLSLFFR